MQNQDANLRQKTSASFYDKAGVQIFFNENVQWPGLILYWQWKEYGDNWSHIVDTNNKC